MLETATFQRVLTILIVVNAITLGLETSDRAMRQFVDVLLAIDRAILSVFVAELLVKLVVYRTRFHHAPWNVFDFIVVGFALIPTTGGLSVLRALRILRVLRLVSAVSSMRRVVNALLHVIPGMGSIIALLALIFYVFSVMATKLFGAGFPDWFGTVGKSAFSLFQVMTLESWSMGIVRPVMAEFPFAWAFFVPFILISSFTVLNLFIGIIVDAMQSVHAEEHEAERQEERDTAAAEREDVRRILAKVQALRVEIAEIKGSSSGPSNPGHSITGRREEA